MLFKLHLCLDRQQPRPVFDQLLLRESGKRFRYVLGVVSRRCISAIGLYVVILSINSSNRYEVIYMKVVIGMSAFGAYQVNLRPGDYCFGVFLALAWHVYIVLAVLYCVLLNFLLV